MKCAIHQPQFLPWLGHFQKISMADVFVFLDSVQFQKNEFQNRNRIPKEDGSRWITVPVTYDFGDAIREVKISNGRPWRRKLWGTLDNAYRRAPGFEVFGAGLKALIESDTDLLGELNMASVRWLMACFGIETPLRIASQLETRSEDRTGRLVDICRAVGATTYLSGSLAQRYLDIDQFTQAGIAIEFQAYEHPVYPQVSHAGAFISHMSAIDGLFNRGGGLAGREALNL